MTSGTKPPITSLRHRGGDSDNYWFYPTGTNIEPHSDNPASLNTPDDTNVGNFYRDDGVANGYNDGYAVTGSTSYSSAANYLTDVGAYTLAESFYGTFDQGGNVWEWNETAVSGLPAGSAAVRGTWTPASSGPATATALARPSRTSPTVFVWQASLSPSDYKSLSSG